MTSYFDNISKWYDNPLNQIYFNIIYKKAIFYIDAYLDSADKLLDIGCGTGNWLVKLQKTYNMNLYGLDASQGMAGRAAAKSTSINLKIGKAENLPYDDEEFDFVTVVESFHHFSGHQEVLSESHRVLKSKGYFFLTDPSLNGWPKYIWLGTKILAFERSSKYFYLEKLASLVKEAGFVIVKSKSEFGNNWILAQKL